MTRGGDARPRWRGGVSPGKVPFGHVAMMALALIVLWSGIAFSLWHEHALAEQEAFQDAGNLTRAFAENITRTVEAVDQILLFVRESYERNRDTFDLDTWTPKHGPLSSLEVQMGLVDRDGFVVSTDRGPADRNINIADREHFRALADSTTDELFIGHPSVGRMSKRLSIQFARKLLTAEGQFDGVVAIALDPEYLSRFYKSINIGGGSIVLALTDKTILARAPEGPGLIVDKMDESKPGFAAGAPPAGQYRRMSRHEPTPKLYSYLRLDDYHLIVTVGVRENDVFAAYERIRLIYFELGSALTAAILVAGLMTLRQRNRLLLSRHLLAVTLENMDQGIELIAADGSVPVINRRAVELLGFPESLMRRKPALKEMIDWQIANGQLGPPDSWPKKLAEAIGVGGIAPGSSFYERANKDGTVLAVRTQQLPDGSAVRTFTDVTSVKRNETELAAARDAAEAGGRARSELLAVMSHEIRTPMTGIIGVAGLLLNLRLPAVAEQYVNIIRESGDHLLRLINGILDFSKLDAGSVELDPQAFDLHAEVNSSAELVAPQAREKHLNLGVKIAGDVPRRVIGDAGRIRQILINLLGNAIKFTAKGDVFLQVTLLRMKTEHGAAIAYLLFEIQDTGIGIAADKTGVLFQDFTQADRSVSRRFGGTGLGLAICKRLVDQMGGDIGFTSKPERGSTFYFSLKLPAVEGESMEPPAAPVQTDSRRYRVLVADDNYSNRLVVTKMLEHQHHSVDTVANGREAVKALQSVSYDVVVMDMMMPDMDGIVAARTIRSLPGSAGLVPMIGLSANISENDRTACLDAGMNLFLTKPVTLDRLAGALSLVMARAGAESLQ